MIVVPGCVAAALIVFSSSRSTVNLLTAQQPFGLVEGVRQTPGGPQRGSPVGPIQVRVKGSRPAVLQNRPSILPGWEQHATSPRNVAEHGVDHPSTRHVPVADHVHTVERSHVLMPLRSPRGRAREAKRVVASYRFAAVDVAKASRIASVSLTPSVMNNAERAARSGASSEALANQTAHRPHQERRARRKEVLLCEVTSRASCPARSRRSTKLGGSEIGETQLRGTSSRLDKAVAHVISFLAGRLQPARRRCCRVSSGFFRAPDPARRASRRSRGTTMRRPSRSTGSWPRSARS